ncbi:MAG TPA: hypothetical protein VHO69_03440 [Phototrophicaceae bacterium]|nr:hypothetical protein [Phototrophicaceae bacterium]
MTDKNKNTFLSVEEAAAVFVEAAKHFPSVEEAGAACVEATRHFPSVEDVLAFQRLSRRVKLADQVEGQED